MYSHIIAHCIVIDVDLFSILEITRKRSKHVEVSMNYDIIIMYYNI